MRERLSLPFYNQDFTRSAINGNSEYLDSLIDLLSDERVLTEAKCGNLTLAMIRPNVGPNDNLLGLDDIETAEIIEGMVEGLGEMAKFSFKFTKEAVNQFYEGDPQASMEKNPPLDSNRFDSCWPEFVEFMASGPTTAILLHSPNGDAIEKWRAHLGHWNLDKFRDPSTIRGKLAVGIYNNLVHGSDTPDSVVRELGIIRKVLDGGKYGPNEFHS